MHYNMLSNWALEYHILIFLFVTVTLKEPLRSPGSRRSRIHDPQADERPFRVCEGLGFRAFQGSFQGSVK